MLNYFPLNDLPISELMTNLYNEEDWKVRERAALVLERINWKPLNETEKIYYFFASQEWDELVKIGKPAIDPLIEALKDNNSSVRENAARTLGKIKDPMAVEPLSKALWDWNLEVRMTAAKALGSIGDKKAVEPLVDNLTDWHFNQVVIEALLRIGWKPGSDMERIHALVAMRDSHDIKKEWEVTKKILLMDVDSDKYRTIENALYAFIGIGENEIIPILIESLNTKGTKTMAEAYLNCGHKELDKAAKEWAARHGYYISKGSGASPVTWGRW